MKFIGFSFKILSISLLINLFCLDFKISRSREFFVIDSDILNSSLYFLHTSSTISSIVCLVLLTILLNRTKTGTYIKATGFNEKAAASVGIHVEAQKIKALVLCGIFCGMGGAYLSMVSLSYFSADMVGGRGFIGIAAEAMGAGIPWLTALFAFLFGVVDSFALGSQAVLGAEYYELLNTLPYLMTLIALIIYAAINKARAAREQHQPTDKSKQTEMTDEKSMAT